MGAMADSKRCNSTFAKPKGKKPEWVGAKLEELLALARQHQSEWRIVDLAREYRSRTGRFVSDTQVGVLLKRAGIRMAYRRGPCRMAQVINREARAAKAAKVALGTTKSAQLAAAQPAPDLAEKFLGLARAHPTLPLDRIIARCRREHGACPTRVECLRLMAGDGLLFERDRVRQEG